MKNFEIPHVKERGIRYRFFEILPGCLSWSILALPFVLSLINPRLTVVFIIAYMLLWFSRSLGLSVRVLQGYRLLTLHQQLPWKVMLQEVESGSVSQPDRHMPTWHYENIRRLQEMTPVVKPHELYHALIVATYNESREVLEPTIQSIINSDYDIKRIIFVLAYEQRGGPQVEALALELTAKYGHYFHQALAVKHTLVNGEIKGKGANITYAGRALQSYLEKVRINPLHVVVTTLDADNRPHPKYLAGLSYLYCVAPDPVHVSFQPIPIFTNNIWDAPAPMRVIATGNSFWNIILSLRPHLLRNFSSHAQSMQALLDTDFWSVRTIVEDGHQFWRTYFAYDGQHEVYPIFLPIYQDAVLSSTLLKTLKAQFFQIRRWAWGASDVAYVAEMGFFRKNKAPKVDVVFKFLRLLEGHVSWAVGPLILAFSALVPSLLKPHDFAANQLPFVASRIQQVMSVGILVTLFVSFKTLPPKPKRYKKHRSIFMVAQWAFLPVTTILYGSCSALYSQTRLIFGKYMEGFDVTDKAVVTADKKKIL